MPSRWLNGGFRIPCRGLGKSFWQRNGTNFEDAFLEILTPKEKTVFGDGPRFGLRTVERAEEAVLHLKTMNDGKDEGDAAGATDEITRFAGMLPGHQKTEQDPEIRINHQPSGQLFFGRWIWRARVFGGWRRNRAAGGLISENG